MNYLLCSIFFAALVAAVHTAFLPARELQGSRSNVNADVFNHVSLIDVRVRQGDEDPAPLGVPLGDEESEPESKDTGTEEKDDNSADSSEQVAGDGDTSDSDADPGAAELASSDSDDSSAVDTENTDVDGDPDVEGSSTENTESSGTADSGEIDEKGAEKETGDGTTDEAKSDGEHDKSTTEESESEGTEVDGAHTIPEGNLTEAFHAFTINQMVEVDDEDSSFKMVPIFQNGSLVGAFESNPMSSDVSNLAEGVDDAAWYNDGPYADRISFQYTFEPDVSDYTISQPVIGVDTELGASPIVQDEQSEPSSGIGSFTVKYMCKPGGVEKSIVSLHIQVTKEHSVDFAWIKVCGHGKNEHLDFGFIRSDDKVTLFNTDGTYGTEEQNTLEVGPLQLSTALTAELTPPAWLLDFLDPHIESNSPLIAVSLRDTIKAGTLNSDSATKFSVHYHCVETSAKATIKFTLGIPPWDNVTASWRKTCGGTTSEALLIGTSGSGSYEVMQDGELNAKYNVTEQSSVEESYGKIEEIEGSKSSVRFYISNGDDISDIHIQTIATTMSNPDVVSAMVDVPFTGSSVYLSAAGGTVPRGQTRSLKLRFTCKKLGESLVLVTLPTLKYKNVEFGFLKHCLAPSVRHHSGFLQTAGSIMGTIFFLVTFGGVAIWVYMRRRFQDVKYAPVSTTERVP